MIGRNKKSHGHNHRQKQRRKDINTTKRLLKEKRRQHQAVIDEERRIDSLRLNILHALPGEITACVLDMVPLCDISTFLMSSRDCRDIVYAYIGEDNWEWIHMYSWSMTRNAMNVSWKDTHHCWDKSRDPTIYTEYLICNGKVVPSSYREIHSMKRLWEAVAFIGNMKVASILARRDDPGYSLETKEMAFDGGWTGLVTLLEEMLEAKQRRKKVEMNGGYGSGGMVLPPKPHTRSDIMSSSMGWARLFGDDFGWGSAKIAFHSEPDDSDHTDEELDTLIDNGLMGDGVTYSMMSHCSVKVGDMPIEGKGSDPSLWPSVSHSAIFLGSHLYHDTDSVYLYDTPLVGLPYSERMLSISFDRGDGNLDRGEEVINTKARRKHTKQHHTRQIKPSMPRNNGSHKKSFR